MAGLLIVVPSVNETSAVCNSPMKQNSSGRTLGVLQTARQCYKSKTVQGPQTSRICTEQLIHLSLYSTPSQKTKDTNLAHTRWMGF